MRSPVTKYGLPQVIIFPALVMLAMALILRAPIADIGIWLIEAVLAAIFIWILSFFRDPKRDVTAEKSLFLAPADGTVTDIEIVDETPFIGQKTLIIGIFLSIFNVHINRAPCDVKIDKITYKKGQFKDARNPQAGRVNESNDLLLTRTADPNDKILLRQISGAVARRIVCTAKPDQFLAGGQKFGMIKFGSRTELYVPAREDIKCMVKIGDKVKAGLSILARYQ